MHDSGGAMWRNSVAFEIGWSRDSISYNRRVTIDMAMPYQIHDSALKFILTRLVESARRYCRDEEATS